MTKSISFSIPKLFRGLRVLLVDNDTSSLLHLASVLEDHSYKVTTTELAEVALLMLEERKDNFDVVIADFNMPEMNCFKFIKKVQTITKIRNFPIILMSSSELKKVVVQKAIKAGVCFFLNKPISTKKLINVWQHVYRTRKNKDVSSEVQVEKENKTRKNIENIEDGEVNINLLDFNDVEISDTYKNWLLSFETNAEFGDLEKIKGAEIEESGFDWSAL